MNINENSPCGHADLVRDYAFDELPPAERKSMVQHMIGCSDCAAQLDGLRLTTAALRVLPDFEVPRRIAFVPDKVPAQGWFANIWNSAARLGFAAACVLSVGLSFAAYHRPAEVRTVVQTASVPQPDIDQAVMKAVALAVDKVHSDDVRISKAALDAVDSKYAQKQQDLMIAMSTNMDYLQRSYLKTARSSYLDAPPIGVRQ